MVLLQLLREFVFDFYLYTYLFNYLYILWYYLITLIGKIIKYSITVEP